MSLDNQRLLRELPKDPQALKLKIHKAQLIQYLLRDLVSQFNNGYGFGSFSLWELIGMPDEELNAWGRLSNINPDGTIKHINFHLTSMAEDLEWKDGEWQFESG